MSGDWHFFVEKGAVVDADGGGIGWAYASDLDEGGIVRKEGFPVSANEAEKFRSFGHCGWGKALRREKSSGMGLDGRNKSDLGGA